MPKYDLLTKQNYIFSGGLIQIIYDMNPNVLVL